MKKIMMLAAVGVSIVSGVAAAETHRPANGTIHSVGSHVGNGTSAFFLLTPGQAPAACGIFYISQDSPAGRAAYATVLQTYTTGDKIGRIDYTVSGSACIVSLVANGPI